MMKPDSLYNSGMKPLMYSDCAAKYKSIKFIKYLFIKKLDGFVMVMKFVIIKII